MEECGRKREGKLSEIDTGAVDEEEEEEGEKKELFSKQWLIITVSVIVILICLCFILSIIWWRHKSRTCSSTVIETNNSSESNEIANNIVDIDTLYAKVNKNKNEVGKTNSNLSNPELERVGIHNSLEEGSLYCEVRSESTRPGS